MYLHGGFGRRRLPIKKPRPKAPARNGFDSFLIQAQAETLQHSDIANAATGVHDDAQEHHALVFRFARLLGKFRIFFIQELRRCDAASALNTQSRRARLRFADSLAAAVVSDPIRAVRAESAIGQSAERVAYGGAGVVGRDVESDGDRQRELGMRGGGGRDKRPERGWRRGTMFGRERGLIASTAMLLHDLTRAEERQGSCMNRCGWFEWRSDQPGCEKQQQREQ